MSFPIRVFNELLEFESSSWAIWSPQFGTKQSLECEPAKIEGYLRQELNRLRPNVVFLGLNRSLNRRNAKPGAQLPYTRCSNFHGAGHRGDAVLNAVIKECGHLTGAFMMDISSVFESDSTKVGEISHEDVAKLRKVLRILGSHPTHLICFGHKVFDAVRVQFPTTDAGILCDGDVPAIEWTEDGKLVRAYRVIHYSYASRYKKVPRLRKQLNSIDQSVSNR